MRQPGKQTVRFDIRMDPQLRRDIARCAMQEEKSDAEFIRDVLRRETRHQPMALPDE